MSIQHIPFEGTYRRQIDLKTWDPHTAVGWLEDDFHHFGITLNHDGSRITDVRVAEPRHPWSACPGAAQPLLELKGKPLFGRCSDIGEIVDMRQQCTHLFDLAGLLIAHIHHRRDHRRYEAAICRLDSLVPDAPADWRRASLACDGVHVLEWDVRGDDIMRPESAAGHTIARGFREWTETMNELEAEYASVMRRAVFVCQGRTVALDDATSAQNMPLPAVCHNYQPEQRKSSVYILNSVRKFNRSTEGMLALVDTRP